MTRWPRWMTAARRPSGRSERHRWWEACWRIHRPPPLRMQAFRCVTGCPQLLLRARGARHHRSFRNLYLLPPTKRPTEAIFCGSPLPASRGNQRKNRVTSTLEETAERASVRGFFFHVPMQRRHFVAPSLVPESAAPAPACSESWPVGSASPSMFTTAEELDLACWSAGGEGTSPPSALRQMPDA